MDDIFKNDIFSTIASPSTQSYSLIGLKLPSNQDIFFMAKWHELFERYESARLFLRKAYEEEWEKWINPSTNSDTEKAAEFNDYVRYFYKAELYETALINYNILVDLSWTITYVSAEFMLYKFDSDGNITNAEEVHGMHPIDEAIEMLRKVENGTIAPSAEGSPFVYLKTIAPKFENAVDLIIKFWNEFSNSEIRSLYNFIKHKGKPLYSEQNSHRSNRIFDLIMGNEKYPSDVRDVQKEVSIEQGIEELIRFDNEQLFPYVDKLITELRKAVNPSPMVM